jgi:hypothetical protein
MQAGKVPDLQPGHPKRGRGRFARRREGPPDRPHSKDRGLCRFLPLGRRTVRRLHAPTRRRWERCGPTPGLRSRSPATPSRPRAAGAEHGRVRVADGVPPEYLAASRTIVGEAGFPAFEEQVRGLYAQMARITITPEWAKLLDFETTLPRAVAQLLNR